MDTDYIAHINLCRITAADIEERSSAVIRSDQNAFFLCTDGEVEVEMDGAVYTIRRGCMYIYPGFATTVVRSYSPLTKGVIAMADFDFVLSLLNNVVDLSNRLFIRFNPLQQLDEAQFNRIIQVIELYERRRDQPTLLNATIVPAIAQVLLYEVVEAYVTNVDRVAIHPTRADVVFQTFFVSLHRHFRTHRDVAFYAAEQCLTPRYFSTIVHQRSGRAPARWIEMFVITEAKRLLAQPATSIKEVAIALNFPNQSFFGRYFKRLTGQSPADFRRHQP